MTVFCAHAVSQDLSAAAAYGELRYVASGYVYGDQLSDDGSLPAGVLDSLRTAAHEFRPRTDYLLIAGDHILFAAMAALLGARYGTFRVLRYDRLAGGYLEVLLDARVPYAGLAPVAAAC